jgi:hypothetical protein
MAPDDDSLACRRLTHACSIASLGGLVMAEPRTITPADARSIAKDAYIYGYPMVDSYRIQYAYSVDRSSPEFKAPWNELKSSARVYTPDDTTIQTPNSDTPYSSASLDLRAEPMVLTLPRVEKNRYFSVQLVDLYTHNFAYLGSRTTGNDGGNYLIAGPHWKSAKPAGINTVFQAETDLVLVLFRTQLFGDGDVENVEKIQAGYKLQSLSQFLGRPAATVPPIDFITPVAPGAVPPPLEFFKVLNFLLQFCPTHFSEKTLMDRFATLNIGAGRTFSPKALSPEMRAAVEGGMGDGLRAFEDFKRTKLDTREVTSGDVFGTRDHLKNNYLYRMAAAKLGIFGNSKEEAMYPVFAVDDHGETLDGSKHRYQVHFDADQLPPVRAFWSLTMYKLPQSLLVANPLHRYLINSPMLPNLKRDPDGGLTLYLQPDSPGKELESNWLPAPLGPFMAALRLYWPKLEALTGEWQLPHLRTV